jgi:hypothetical protein
MFCYENMEAQHLQSLKSYNSFPELYNTCCRETNNFTLIISSFKGYVLFLYKMKRNRSIPLKVSFLIVVFLFNTVMSFACSLGMEWKLNSSHHDEQLKSSHVHDDHHHLSVQTNKNTWYYQQTETSKDDCCSDEVVQLAKVDKVTTQSPSYSFHPIFITLFVSSFYHFDFSFLNNLSLMGKYIRHDHPPSKLDIRIAIRSFQI